MRFQLPPLVEKIYHERKDRLLFAAVAGALLLLVLISWQNSSEKTQTPEAPVAVDTEIPEGFELVGIELENHEALDSIVGTFAVVNLYQSSILGEKRGQLIGKNLRLLRAPLNPQKFAILVPTADAANFMKVSKFFASIQNRNRLSPTEMASPKTPRQRRTIEYYKGGTE